MMRCAIVTDVHGNLEALEAVLADAGTVDQIWCLGDLVGYGPDPNECIEVIRSRNALCIAGNHDWLAIGKQQLDALTPMTIRQTVAWLQNRLTPEHRAFLGDLPEWRTVGPSSAFTLVHSCPSDPIGEKTRRQADRLRLETAETNFAALATPYALVGHSHVPVLYREVRSERELPVFETGTPSPAEPVVLGQDRLIVNPGSVGNPRDGDPRAAYMLFEQDGSGTGELWLRRVPYDIGAVVQKLHRSDMPAELVDEVTAMLERARLPSPATTTTERR